MPGQSARDRADYIEGGESLDEFLDGFPSVKREQAIRVLEEMKVASCSSQWRSPRRLRYLR